MKIRREPLLFLLLFTLVIGLLVAGPHKDTTNDERSRQPSTYASAPEGALALYRWLDQIGYQPLRLQFTHFALPPSTAACIILSPPVPMSDTETDTLLTWVDAGGLLIVAEDAPVAASALEPLLTRLGVESVVAPLKTAPLTQPVLRDPTITALPVNAAQLFRTNNPASVPLAGTEEGAAWLAITHGQGRILLVSSSYPFSNKGLAESANAGFILNIVQQLPAGARIVFDEIHHGYYTPPSLVTAVLGSPWGRAALYALLLTALYLILSGRRFGRPLPLPEQTAVRSMAEYVESMADLFQRSHKQPFVMHHYADMLKRRLAKPYGLNPTLDDTQFVRALARCRTLDEARLLGVLQQLRQPHLSQHEALRVLQQADTVLSQVSAR